MSEKYQKLNAIEHIHKRPDMYIGTNKTKDREYEFIWKDGKIHFEKNAKVNEGFVRIFLEALSNAVDNFYRSQDGQTKMNKMTVKINPETGVTSIWNDGNHIPITIHEKEQIYIPELIFGHLLSGSNYNDEEERLTSGRNGLGVKLLNVFSTTFQIECYDPEHQLLYKQKWTNNMTKCTPPTITEKSDGHGYTKITWKPDFEKFGMEGYDDFHLGLYQKLVIDASMVMKIPVYWNKERYVFKQFKDYVKLYIPEDTKIVDGKMENIDYCITPSFCEASHVSFVNGMITKDGGIHVERFQQELYRHILTKLGKLNISSKDLKPHFNLFITATVTNPEFSSQSKTKLIGGKSNLQIVFPKKVLNNIFQWDFMNDLVELHKMKEMISLKKTEKKRGFRRIDGFDPANMSGGKNAKDCVLILCEGLSAKTYSVQGISKGFGDKKGRNWFGIYPLRGKCLNVRNKTLKSISDNKEIIDIIHCLNLRFDADYSNDADFQTLAYGKVCIITDADEDGHHICSLLLNFFHKLFPSLMSRSPPFFSIMMTPIAKIKSRGNVQTFYNDIDYQKALTEIQQNGTKFDVKYYKGLGTSSNAEIKESFGEKVVSFIHDETTDSHLNMIFHKQYSENRKEWLLQGRPTDYETPAKEYPISLYLNQELIKYSLEDCKRSIPNLFDGLKVSQRKILYSVFKKSLTPGGKSLKVAQLAGYCAENSNYHHGEQCLHETIIKMCHDFPGSNNIPYLEKDGQFGSRIYGGKDAANARYIFTKMTTLSRLLFPAEDDCLLTYTLDDGMKVEPDFYLPILPLILINGCTAGIGTGWSCSIPCFHPLEVMNIVRDMLLEKESISFDIQPFYNGFKGNIISVAPNKYRSSGILEKVSLHTKEKYKVSELPIGMWTDKFKEELESLQEVKKIKSFKNYSSTDNVHFEFEKGPTDFKINEENLKLNTHINLTNMVLFGENDVIQKFPSIQSIVERFFEKRMELYEIRKKTTLEQFSSELRILQNKRRFIEMVLVQEIVLTSMDECRLQTELQEKGFETQDDCYDYLLRIPIRDFTKNKITTLEEKIRNVEANLISLKKTKPSKLWLHDLDIFEKEYKKIYM